MSFQKIAISTPSLGRHPTHRLDAKIKFAARSGFSGIEIVFGDLEIYAKSRQYTMLQGAEEIRRLCQQLNVAILSLAPFENFEGSNTSLPQRLEKAQIWIEIARRLGATYLQVPAQYDEKCRANKSAIVSDLQQLADLASSTEPKIAIAYEPMSWSVHNSTWEDALDTINAVGRENFGLCLDSFHIITKLWASPFEPSGKFKDADQDLALSLDRFKTQFPLDKLFYVQLSDGERFDPPFSKNHPWYLEGEAPEFTWSKHARPFPLEVELGGYMPVAQFLKTCVVYKGFKGWISMEVFDRRMREAAFEPERAAIRGQISLKKLLEQAKETEARL